MKQVTVSCFSALSFVGHSFDDFRRWKITHFLSGFFGKKNCKMLTLAPHFQSPALRKRSRRGWGCSSTCPDRCTGSTVRTTLSHLPPDSLVGFNFLKKNCEWQVKNIFNIFFCFKACKKSRAFFCSFHFNRKNCLMFDCIVFTGVDVIITIFCDFPGEN
jgi:hypothetical protein